MSPCITSVWAKGFKGTSFQTTLSVVTVITGDNFARKTARLEAISLALLGYVPTDTKAIKASRDIYDKFGGSSDTMEVGVNMKGMPVASVVRTWRKKGEKVSYSGPDGPVVPETVLDALAYTSLTGPARQTHLFDVSGAAAKQDIKKVVDTMVANVKNIVFEDNTAHTEDVLGQVATAVRSHGEGVADAQRWIETFAEFVTDWLKGEKANVERLEHSAQAAAQVASDDEPPAPDCEQRLADARLALEVSVKAYERLDAEIGASRERWLEQKRIAVANPWTEEQQTELTVLTAEQTKLKEVKEPKDAGEQAKRDEAYEEWVTADQQYQHDQRILKETEEKLEDLTADKPCPRCGKRCACWKGTRESQLAEVKKWIVDANVAVGKTREVESVASAKLKKADKALSDSRTANHKYNTALLRLTELNGMVQTLEGQRDRAAQRDAAKLKMQEIEERGKHLNSELGLETEKKRALQQDVDRYDADVKRLVAQRAEKAAQGRVTESVGRARALKHALAQTQAMVGALKMKLVEDAIAPFVGDMNGILSGITPSPVEFAGGDLVFKRGYGASAASDAERMLMLTSLCFALSRRSPLKLVAVGRMESLGLQKRRELIRAAIGLVDKGVVHQCIFVEVDDTPEASTKYTDLKLASPHFSVVTLRAS